MLQRRLRRDERAADVDVDHAVQLLEGGLLELLGNGGTGVVHEHVQSAEGCHGLFDRGLHGVGIGGIRLDGDRPSASAFDLLHDPRGRVPTLGVSDGHTGPVGGETFGDRRANAA